MGKLERAKIYVLKDDGKKDSKSDYDSATPEFKDGIDVCFNPKEYSLEKSVSWDSEKALTDAPQPEFTKPSAMTLSVTLQFDTYEERVSVREKYMRRLEKLAMMRGDLSSKKKPSAKEKNAASPPVILFVWGRFTFKGVVESLSQKYTMFLSDGTPVRGEVGLKIRNVLTAALEKEGYKGGGGGASASSYTVKQGDRLDSIAASELGDASRWTDIAAENGIDDPMSIKPGDVLSIPQ